MDDDEPLFPSDDLARYARGELPRDWLRVRVAILKRRAEQLAADVGALKATDSAADARLCNALPRK